MKPKGLFVTQRLEDTPAMPYLPKELQPKDSEKDCSLCGKRLATSEEGLKILNESGASPICTQCASSLVKNKKH